MNARRVTLFCLGLCLCGAVLFIGQGIGYFRSKAEWKKIEAEVRQSGYCPVEKMERVIAPLIGEAVKFERYSRLLMMTEVVLVGLLGCAVYLFVKSSRTRGRTESAD